MKKCDQVKDLILTDYIDGELDKNLAGSVESHLLDCSDCRAFLKEVKDNAVEPWRQARHLPPPAELWGAVRQSIEQESRDAINGVSTRPDFIDKLKGLFVFPRLVPVFASLILMLLAGSVTLNMIQIRQAKDKDQGEYLVSLLSPTGASASMDNNDWGTPVEHYFL